MTIKVGINGFGRMGRLTFRAAYQNSNIEIVQINDPAGDAITFAHLLEFDSVHGRWDKQITAGEHEICVAGRTIPFTRNIELAATNWSACDVIIEASGKFKSTKTLQPYLDQGVKRIVVTAPVKEDYNNYFEANLDYELNYWGNSMKITRENQKCNIGEFATTIGYG